MHRRPNKELDKESPLYERPQRPDQVTRSPTGQWLPGIPSPNPTGRPKDTVSAMLREAIHTQLTPDKVSSIAATLIRQCVDGDPKAREHLLAFFGVNLRTLDIAMAADNKVEIRVVYDDGQQGQAVLEGEYVSVEALPGGEGPSE